MSWYDDNEYVLDDEASARVESSGGRTQDWVSDARAVSESQRAPLDSDLTRDYDNRDTRDANDNANRDDS